MISEETEKIVSKWQLDFFSAEVDRESDSFRKFINSEREVREQFRKEMDEIEKKLREFYKINK